METVARAPRILLLDIENTPYTVYTWDNDPRTPISHKNIVTEQQMISAAWQWAGTKKVYSEMIKVGGDDKHLTQTLQYQVSQADAVVAHFGDGHDIPMISRACLRWGLGPLKPVIQIDTWKLAKSKFKLFNNKLDYIAQFLNQPQKIETDFDLWKRVMRGERKARREMLKYNKEDVRVLARVWKQLKPFAPAKLNRTLFVGDDVLASRTCPSCGEPKLQRYGTGYTRTGIRINLKCSSCGAWCYRLTSTRPR